KSEENNNIYIANVPLLTREDTVASIIDIHKVNINSAGLQNITRYQLTLDTIYFNILWNVKGSNERRRNDLYLLTTFADKYSRVFYFNFSDTVSRRVKIFEYSEYHNFYTSLDTYNNDKYFICVGGESLSNGHLFSTWDKYVDSWEIGCENIWKERYSMPNSETRGSRVSLTIYSLPFVQHLKYARNEKMSYNIKCQTKP
ncbi:MAG: hypothetical protein Q4Q06_05245, partial [Bacteroidota bacterium]|nr:hypothetical protein [Bacteroidota bacterium]